MACLTTEKTSPLGQQKRCSLPGPMGALNLYATHQQRRLSERGLMIYKPNKPDIDLIRDFTNPSKKSTPSFICDRDPGSQNQQRRHSTIINVMASTSVNSPSTSSAPWLGSYSTTERRHSSIIPSSFHPHTPSTFTSLAGPSAAKQGQSSAKSSTPPSMGNFSAGSVGSSTNPSITLGSCSGPSSAFASGSSANKRNSSPSISLPTTSTSGCRKVRLRIRKNPGAKEKLLHFTPMPGRGPVSATTSPVDDEDQLNFLRHPHCDIRRYSDSAATIRHPPHISITPDGVTGRGSRAFCADSGIVCTTGDLLTLKCLTSSAQEIRCGSNANNPSPASAQSPQSLGNRSRSFDATIVMARKGPGSSWFSRRHQPIAVKLPLPINSPTISSPGDTRYFPGNAAGILRTPILTITNENASKSELIEIPSPPAASPASSRNSPEERTKVAWDKNGFVLDAAVLGIAIENHLRKVDMRRRATFSALYQPPPVFLESKVTTRARSASACVIPIPISVTGRSEDESGSSVGCSSKATSCRKSSLTSSGRVFSWDRVSVASPLPPAPASTSVSFSSVGSAGSSGQYETHLHRLPLNMGMSASVYMNQMDSPTAADSFLNFRATEDDIEEENLMGEEDEEDEEPKETQAFLPQRASVSKSSTTTRNTPAPSQRPNPGNQQSSGGSQNNPIRGNGMSICSAIRDFILQSIRS